MGQLLDNFLMACAVFLNPWDNFWTTLGQLRGTTFGQLLDNFWTTFGQLCVFVVLLVVLVFCFIVCLFVHLNQDAGADT